MNRYIIQGLIGDAVEGRKVLFVGGSDEIDEMFHELKRVAGDRIEKAVAANGRQTLHFKGGGAIRLKLGRAHGLLHGMAADVVFITRPYAYDPDLVDSAAVVVICSPVGEVIRA